MAPRIRSTLLASLALTATTSVFYAQSASAQTPSFNLHPTAKLPIQTVKTTPPVIVTAAVPTAYQTVPGDSLWGISQRFGIDMDALASTNQMNLYDVLAVGRTLKLPAPGVIGPTLPLYAPAPVVPVAAPVTAYVPHVATYTAPTVYQASAAPVAAYQAPVTYQAPAYQPPAYQAPAAPSAAPGGIWGCIAQGESGGNPAENTGNGFYGAFQDTPSSWAAAGGLAYAPSANLASYADQLLVNERLQQMQGFGAWPNTSRACGV